MSDESNDIAAELGALFEGIEQPEAENELVALSQSFPIWQRDALRRIAQHGNLSDADQEMLKSAMYSEHGLDNFEGELIAFSSDHCQVDPNTVPLAMLCSIGPVENINRLASAQPPLQFAPQGITLIYGDNGSGKSGYIRISKKVCRARAEDDLLGDAYSKEQGEPKANIRWQFEGDSEVKELTWNPEQTPPIELSSISVFDTKHAAMYVDEKRQMAFLPFEVELYKQLADLVSMFAEEVAAEIETTEQAFAVLPEQIPGTKAAALVDAVMNATGENNLPSEAEIETFTKWDEQDEERLQKIRLQAAQSPLSQADLRVRCVGTLNRVAANVEALETALSETRAKEIEQKYLALQTAKETNELAAQKSFSDLPLGAVGSKAWQDLFRYAREYAGQGDPDHEFPYTGEEARCVLCQQPLDEEAKQRFVRFDNFVSGKATEDYNAKSADYTDTVQALTNLPIPDGENVTAMLAEYVGISEESAQNVEALSAFWVAVTERRDAFILAAIVTGKFDGIGAGAQFSTVLRDQIAALEAEEAQFRKAAEDDGKQKEQALELAEMEGRKSLVDNAVNLFNNRTNKEKWLRLSACAAGLSTAGISRKVSKLREEHLTSELNDKIQTEIQNLGLSYLNVSLKDETKKGESNFESDLGFKQPIKANSTVLSEGEQRGLALACYLAEADLSPTKYGLIVDDPVSSLDHQRIELVARRLAEESAKGRQIIIFTHNILFYLEVEKQAAEMRVGLAQNTIHRHLDHGAGIIEASMVPHQARKVAERINALRNELASMQAEGLDPQGDEYRKAVENICTDLRKAWERLVEEVLLNKSVERFSYGVKTQSLKGVVVEDDDYQQIYFAMEKLSNFAAHDEAAGKQGELPSVEQLMEAVNELDNYRIEIKKRASETGKSRKKLEEPPKADFA